MNLSTKKAFTLAEILVATFIGAMILSFIFIFLGDIVVDIHGSKKILNNTKNSLELSLKLNSYKDSYNSGYILLDNDTASGSDLFIFKDTLNNEGLLFGMINLSTYKLNTDNSLYKNNVLGFRNLNSDDLISIESNIDNVFGFLFQKDKVFSDLIIKDIQITSFNSGAIHNLDLYLNPNYVSSLNGELWEKLPVDDIVQLNIDF